MRLARLYKVKGRYFLNRNNSQGRLTPAFLLSCHRGCKIWREVVGIGIDSNFKKGGDLMVYYIKDKIVSKDTWIEYLEDTIRKISRYLDHIPHEEEEGKKILREAVKSIRRNKAKNFPNSPPFY